MFWRGLLFLSLFLSLRSYGYDAQTWFDQSEKGIHTDAVIVSYDHKTLFEKYARGYMAETPHLSWSMAKTVAGILIARACEDRHISLETPVKHFLPAFKGTARIIDFLQMSSGIDFSEEYYGLPVNSDVVKMLYLDGYKSGMADYVHSLPLYQHADLQPGQYYYYSSGDTNVLMAVLRKIINNDTDYNNYPYDKLFSPLGIKTVYFEKDSQGNYVGSSYLYMSAQDYVKLGYLIVDGGRAPNGQQLIPKSYYERMFELAPGVKLSLQKGADVKGYSLQVATNQTGDYPDLPKDALLFLGHQGQMLIASPKEKMVILRLGMDKGQLDKNQFLQSVKETFLKVKTDYTVVGINDKKAKDQKSIFDLKKYTTKKDFHLSDLFKVPQLIRAFTAKEFCSCYFITGRGFDRCYEDVAIKMPVMPKIEVIDKVIKTQFIFGDHAQAQFEGQPLGCSLKIN